MAHYFPVIAFDPGLTTGWATFLNGDLMRAGFGELATIDKPLPWKDTTVLVEKPQWRVHERKIDINDLIKLAIMVGELKNFYESRDARVDLITPTSWKGSVPKSVHGQRILRTLTSEELALVPLRPRAKTPDHNCLDAIGLGLWKLGRLR